MASKKQMAAFNKDVVSYINSLGAEQFNENGCFTSYKLNTIAGLLYIHLEQPEASKVFTIFARFNDVQRAKELVSGRELRLNQYSGKWNFHTYSHEETINQFKRDVSSIISIDVVDTHVGDMAQPIKN